MGQKGIFPQEVIENSYEQVVSDYGKSTKVLYLTVLSAIVLLVVSLFFVTVDGGVTAVGTIKPLGEHVLITAPNNGKLSYFEIKENDKVCEGDTLLTVWSDNIVSTVPALQQRQTELEKMLSDLEFLVKGLAPKIFQSPQCMQNYNYYIAQMGELKLRRNLEKSRFQREKSLFEKNMSAIADYEAYETSYKQSEFAVNALKRKQMAQWRTDQLNYQNELNDIIARLAQIDIQNKESVVISPINGNVHRISNVNENSYVHSGQELLELSPDGDLFVECYVTSKDIGLVKKGMRVRFRVDAFDYTQWGVLNGSVVDISDDITMLESAAYYKIHCCLDSQCLILKNGFQGCVKKGMTVNARMIVNKRTVAQLLYDKVDNWLNPTL